MPFLLISGLSAAPVELLAACWYWPNRLVGKKVHAQVC